MWAGSVQRLTGAAVEESAHRQGPDWCAGKLGANQAGAHAKLPTSGQAGKAERSAGSQAGASLRPRLFTGACSVHTGSVPGLSSEPDWWAGKLCTKQALHQPTWAQCSRWRCRGGPAVDAFGVITTKVAEARRHRARHQVASADSARQHCQHPGAM